MTGSYKDYEAYEDDTDPRAKRLRYAIYALLITTALGSVVGRILAVKAASLFTTSVPLRMVTSTFAPAPDATPSAIF